MHILGIEFINLRGEEIKNQLHEGIDFFLRSGPVLCGKGIQGEGMDAQVIRVPDDFTQVFCALPMAFGNGETVALGPASVAGGDA